MRNKVGTKHIKNREGLEMVGRKREGLKMEKTEVAAIGGDIWSFRTYRQADERMFSYLGYRPRDRPSLTDLCATLPRPVYLRHAFTGP